MRGNALLGRKMMALMLAGAIVLAGGMLQSAAAEEKLKVAAVFGTPIEEPWVNQIHIALLKAEKELGIQYEWSERVKPADFARVTHEYAGKGCALILGDAFGVERIARQVAREYPGTAFVFGSGFGPAEPNFAVFDNWIHEPAYLSGMIAGKITKRNLVGVVAAMAIPEVNRLVNAFCAGAKEVNPEVAFKLTFIGAFFDPPKAREAALVQIEAGVDVIYAERFGVIEAAAEKGILAISNMSDQYSLAPATVITGPVWDMGPTVKYVIAAVKAGVFTAQDFGDFSSMSKGGSHLAPYHQWAARLPAGVREMVEKRSREIIDGAFRVIIDESIPESESR